MKIVAKSIRDRVALIQWRRERIWPALQPPEPLDPGSPEKAKGPPAPLQVQVTYHAQMGPPESEEPEADQHLLPPVLPASATSLACEYSPGAGVGIQGSEWSTMAIVATVAGRVGVGGRMLGPLTFDSQERPVSSRNWPVEPEQL